MERTDVWVCVCVCVSLPPILWPNSLLRKRRKVSWNTLLSWPFYPSGENVWGEGYTCTFWPTTEENWDRWGHMRPRNKETAFANMMAGM